MGLTSSGQPIKPPMGADAFAGPGVAYQGFGEFNQRHWLRQWSDCLEREPGTVLAADMGAPAFDLGQAVPGAAR
jgi:hypothetical protein